MIWGAFCSMASSIGSAIGSAFSSAASVITSACSNIISVAGNVIEKGIEAFHSFANTIETVLQAVGVIPPQEKIEDLGDRAHQAERAGISPDNFPEFDEYMAAIRAFKLDPEQSKAVDPMVKLTVGLGVASRILEHKLDAPDGSGVELMGLVAQNPEYLTVDRMVSILSKTSDIASVVEYFNGRLEPQQSLSTEKVLVEAEKSLSPNKDERTIYAELDSASRTAQNLDH